MGARDGETPGSSWELGSPIQECYIDETFMKLFTPSKKSDNPLLAEQDYYMSSKSVETLLVLQIKIHVLLRDKMVHLD